MSDLEWVEAEDGYQSDSYRVRRISGRSQPCWRLEIAARVPSSGSAVVTASMHDTLRAAFARAEDIERERARHDLHVGHLVIGLGAGLVFAVMAPFVGSVATFVAALVLLWLSLRSLSNAVGVLLGDAWGWPRDRGEVARVTWSDHAAIWLARQLGTRAVAGDQPEAMVRVLQPPG